MAWNFATNIVKGAVSDISFMDRREYGYPCHKTLHLFRHRRFPLWIPVGKIGTNLTPSILQPLMKCTNRSALVVKHDKFFVRQDKLKAEQSKSTTAQFWKDWSDW